MNKIVTLFLCFVVTLTMATAQNLTIYVSPTGDDAADGSNATPLQTIGRALEMANGNDTITRIKIASGVYNESHTLELRSNLTIEGGLSSLTWYPNGGTTELTINTVETFGDCNHKIGLRSDNDTNWMLKRLSITVAAATDTDQSGSGKGASVYVLHISGSSIGTQIVDCQFTAGNGGNGQAGIAGENGANGNGGGEGGPGGLSEWTNEGLDVGTGGAGAGGSDARGGGRGGNGGEGSVNHSQGGNAGSNGSTGGQGIGGQGGAGGAGGAAGHNGTVGENGYNGADGQTIASGNTYSWYQYFVPAERGNNGTDGLGGGGAAGGGGGGGATNYIMGIPGQYCGGAGGGGGGGGQGGTGGTPGAAGGSSFGIYCYETSTPIILNTTIVTGTAGQGGQGGAGGQGGQGGAGGDGGGCSSTGSAGQGANGGRGGRGGNGGNGENGANGTAELIAVVADSSLVSTNISMPYVAVQSYCSDGSADIVLSATPGFGGQTCQWFLSATDSLPVAISTDFNIGPATEGTYYVATYDTSRNIGGLDRVAINIHPSYYETDAVTILDTELPYTYRDTTFEIGTTSGTYVFRHTTAAGCDSILTLSLTVNHEEPEDTSSINNYDAHAVLMNIYPNPTSGEITIACSSVKENTSIHLYTIFGKKLWTKMMASQQMEINLSNLPSGIYFLQMTENGNILTTEKIIKQ